ncbi:ATP-binding cassette domain-containing protein [Rhodoplanes sp. TEM]|uniref:ATP-binding cassette domain-containing protein n=1 Tax=Rhodoplanes tepidamans TaxID=200616 RepID=A0ABT5J4P6_RHOTP|nr:MULTISPECIES: ATP-binding cassette domain-containing protein [Rhodoplanes]MDC7784386.1 ATP-binding cassette domain-containing protein [Rhodoplanes tepidamans]MDC7985165.1 ATP-binding cassette domain-containing protein [Rhodoplanes sp. TEM]MDQ0354485.1 branched-chain amino acid transport system ATP-binding protein [Rhodoplanes tepidamans]
MSEAGAEALLTVDGIGKRFRGVVAVKDVSFTVAPRSVLGLIGPNGSGKTTLLNIVNGVLAPDQGEIRLSGAVTTGRRPSDLAALGVARTFQAARVFSTLTVTQNLFVPLLHQRALERRAAHRRALELLAFVGLERHADRVASELSGGQQRLLEFARTLVTRPKIVLMDEPFAGVHPQIKATLIRCIRETVAAEGASFLIVSHEVPDLVAMSDRMVCLVEGAVAAWGLPADVIREEKVIDGYLGRSEEAA